ncbi:MAG TPA: YeeE/YedE family protein [Rhodospirillales bacterium]
MENFTPGSGFAGGILIGAASSLLILLNGRIAGISGILGGAFGAPANDIAWRVAFVAGLVLGPLVVGAVAGPLPDIAMQASPPVLIVAGLLVGFGTRLGNGCTSGHGVCGIARGSRRSLAATAVFIAVAALTVFVVRHVLGG